MKTVKGESLTIEDVCDVAYKMKKLGFQKIKNFGKQWKNQENF